MANNNVKYKLKGHGSFVVREGWLSKALLHVHKDNTMFREKKAADRLGVGSNMAQSIRYWLKACELMTETTKDGAKLSPLGKIIYEYDPYFEDIFTLWILHCNLVANVELATSWHLFFNECEVDEYTRDELCIQMDRKLKTLLSGASYSESSMKDDIVAITNMYAKERNTMLNPEDDTASPFAALGLLKEKNHRYTKVQPNLSILDDKVVLYIICKIMLNEKSISIDELQTGINSIGNTLNLSRITLNQYLDKLENQGDIRINRTAGLDVVYKESTATPLEIVKEYYMNAIG